MSAYGLHPTFDDLDGYRAWRAQWRVLYGKLTTDIRRLKRRLVRSQRANPGAQATHDLHKKLHGQRVMATKALTLLETAKQRWKRILDMHAQIEGQMGSFPQVIESCPVIDFHFNRGSIEFRFLPMWTVKARGRTFYVHHVDFDATGTTREMPDHPSTKGLIRFRHANLELLPDGSARIVRKEAAAMAQAA